jgi:hypothetical protein
MEVLLLLALLGFVGTRYAATDFVSVTKGHESPRHKEAMAREQNRHAERMARMESGSTVTSALGRRIARRIENPPQRDHPIRKHLSAYADDVCGEAVTRLTDRRARAKEGTLARQRLTRSAKSGLRGSWSRLRTRSDEQTDPATETTGEASPVSLIKPNPVSSPECEACRARGEEMSAPTAEPVEGHVVTETDSEGRMVERCSECGEVIAYLDEGASPETPDTGDGPEPAATSKEDPMSSPVADTDLIPLSEAGSVEEVRAFLNALGTFATATQARVDQLAAELSALAENLATVSAVAESNTGALEAQGISGELVSQLYTAMEQLSTVSDSFEAFTETAATTTDGLTTVATSVEQASTELSTHENAADALAGINGTAAANTGFYTGQAS